MERRLAAILAADVVGYTRLMGADEAGTLRRLTEMRQKVLGPLIAEHHGRVVKLIGDGLLVEFASVVDALICAVAWQARVAEHQAEGDAGDRLRFRLGVNLGDVIVEGDDIHGEGVNLAARLEGLAEPGGICLSGDAYRQVRGKIEVTYEDLGERQLKNIAEPVRVYRVVVDGEAGESSAGSFEDPIGLDVSVPDFPSIAVLPFANMSTDPEQEFFSDGITEDIITALSKIPDLLVIARNSTVTYKDRAVDIKQVGREQGVRYVLEGSVRKAGKRVRVTAQLVDAATGHHLWAERYDRDLEDIFAVQDEITREVVIALDIRLRGGELARFWSGGTGDLEAWECVRLAMDLLNRGTLESAQETQLLCRKALDLDPDYAMAWVTLGWAYHHGVDVGLGHAATENRQAALAAGLDCANRALALDPSCADAYSLKSLCHLSRGEHDLAIAMSEQAVALAPSHAEILGLCAMVLNKAGRPDRSLDLIKKALRHCPVYPGWFLSVLGTAYRLTGQTEAAVRAFEAAIKRHADFLALHVGLASTLGELGRQADAKKPVSEILRLSPDFSIKTYMAGLSFRDPKVTARFEDGLRKAGLPE